jgi:hypothetical protein
MREVIVTLGTGSRKLKALPHRSQQQVDSLDRRRDLVGLETTYGRLLSPDPASQALLAEASPFASLSNQLTGSHPGDYNKYVMIRGEAGSPDSAVVEEGFDKKRAAGSRRSP